MIQLHNKNSIYFKSKPLYDVKIYDGQKAVPAKFTQLDVTDDEDVKAMKDVAKIWKGDQYSEKITSAFIRHAESPKSQYSYYALELDKPGISLGKKIKGLVFYFNPSPSVLKLFNVQVSPDSKRNALDRKYKNVGTSLISGLIKEVNDNISRITTKTVQKEFYKNLGFRDTEPDKSLSEMVLDLK